MVGKARLKIISDLIYTPPPGKEQWKNLFHFKERLESINCDHSIISADDETFPGGVSCY